MTGIELTPLRHRLRRDFDLDTHQFHYATMLGDEAAAADALVTEMRALPAPVHLVGHSLGGLIILELFDRHAAETPPLPPGRVVLLGSPVNGSRAATGLSQWPLVKHLLGPMPHRQLVDRAPRRWTQPRELGTIAGTSPMGLGQFAGGFDGAHDGTVAVAETRLEGATAQITLPVSHTGMGLSSDVARQVGTFLATGHFAPP
jgi:pimeloyl-ACP methyl ester carboxylesterase